MDRLAKRYGGRPSAYLPGLSHLDALAFDLGCMESGIAAEQRIAETAAGTGPVFPVLVLAGG